MIETDFLRKMVDRMIDDKHIFGATMCVESGDGRFAWTGSAGVMQNESRYFIASVTKLYMTAIVMQLIEAKACHLDDAIARYLAPSWCDKLHVLKGIDYSNDLTLRHLISNTSGLPDYFFYKQADGRTAAQSLLSGEDQAWNPKKTIQLVKGLKPHFPPGKKGKASYSDTNYQLLGVIIEKITNKSLVEVFNTFIFLKLALKNTYVYSDIHDHTPMQFYYGKEPLWLPKYMVSIAAEGGIVSTAQEVMIFLKAFFDGTFFPKEKIEALKSWNLILPPPGLFYYGIGLERLPTPWILSPFKPIKEIVGFWGQTGSFAFYNSDTDIYFTGTTNQINGKGHAAAAKMMLKTIKSLL